MLTKHSLITALVGVNLVLAAALVFSFDLVPEAYADRGGRPGDFSMCTVVVKRDIGCIYILDHADRKLHCFAPTRGKDGTLSYVQTRDLESDFRRTE